jgi:integrase
VASIETRTHTDGTTYRVVWRQDGTKQYERFPSATAAARFQRIVEAHGNRWPHGWVRGVGFESTQTDGLPTFGDWAERTINSRARANSRTRHDYLRDVKLHLAPTFGTMLLDEISRQMVGEWLIALSKSLSPKSVKNVHSLASSLMADAIDARLVSYNPFRGAVATLPTTKHEEMVFLSRPEFDAFLPFVDLHYRPLVQTLALTGTRWSEATALEIGNLDLAGRRLTVVQAWKRTPESYFELGEPKSARSRRTISIPPSLARTLEPLVEGRAAGEFVFRSMQDRPVRHANFRERVWLPAIKAAQEKKVMTKQPRIHDLRHSHASWLIAARVPLPAIQRRLGHESITTTIDRYGHLSPELDDAISAALEQDAEE